MEGRISKVKAKKRTVNIIIFTVLALGSILMLYPFVWMIFTSFKPKLHVYISGLLPQVWTTESYTQIWGEIDLVRGFLNTILYSIPPVIIGSLVSVAAAYAFAKIRFKGRNALFLVLLGSIMIPFPSIMVPQYVLFSGQFWIFRANLLQSPWPLILPKITGNVMMIFFLRQYLFGVPDSLVEAAKIDGCSHLRIYWQMILPIAIPALSAHGVLWFIGAWNDYLAPTMFIKNPDWHPVTVMIAKFNEQYAINNHVPRIMAGSVMLIVPVLIIYGFFQRWIIESMMFSSVKE